MRGIRSLRQHCHGLSGGKEILLIGVLPPAVGMRDYLNSQDPDNIA
jgi:hypothetical protein